MLPIEKRVMPVRLFSFSLTVSLLAVSVAFTTNPGFAQVAAPASAPASTEARKAWGFDKSDIAPDSAVRFGVLPNGMRYAVMNNKTPKHNASVRMRFDIGSTADLKGQEGGAHFLEHMAFNGSKRVPEGEMIKLLERLGLAFGADTNASTSFTETTYKLDLPQVTPALIDTAMMLMRETASELTLAPAAVERERGIILGEMRARENFGLRQFRDQIAFLAPGTPIAKGLPIGNEAGIRGVTAAGLRTLYDSYYSPERATLVVIGDVDPAVIEAQIVKAFSDWRAKSAVKTDPVAATIATDRPFSAKFFIDPDVPTSVSISAIRPARTQPDTAAQRATMLAETLANAIVNRRLAALARQSDARFTNGVASITDLLSTAQAADISMVAKDRDWKAALATGEQELRRALTHGFTQAELTEQLANIRTATRNAVDQASTRTNAALAGGILGAVEANKVFSSPADGLARFEAVAARLKLADVNAAFNAAWGGVQPLVYVGHNSAVAEAELAAAWEGSKQIAVAAPTTAATQAFAHTDFGQPGKIVADTRVTDLNVRTLRFANNVMLNIKKTDFEKEKVRVSVRVGGGLLEFPQKPEGLATFMSGAFAAGGTTKHSADELQSVLAGKSVAATINPAEDSLSSYSTTTPTDLELQLQLIAALVSAPGYRKEGEAQWRNQVGAFLPTLESQPGGVAARDLPRVLASGDTRFGIANEAALKALDFEALKKVITAALSSGTVEIGIVGDVDEEKVIALVAKTFGAFPARLAQKPSDGAGSRVAFPTDRAPITLRHSGKPDQGLALVYWPTTDDRDARRELRMELLSSVVQLLVTEQLRETLGATYSPRVSSNMSSVFPGYGHFSVASTAEPSKIDQIFGAIDAIAASIAAKPPSADLITRARNPMIESIERNRNDNGWWQRLIDEAQTRPTDLKNAREAEAILKSVTAKELQEAAKLYLKPASTLRVRIIPKG